MNPGNGIETSDSDLDKQAYRSFKLMNPGNGIETNEEVTDQRIVHETFKLMNPGNGIETCQGEGLWGQFKPNFQTFKLMNPGNGIETYSFGRSGRQR